MKCKKCREVEVDEGYEDELCDFCFDEQKQDWKLAGLCEDCGSEVPKERPYSYQLCNPCWKRMQEQIDHDLVFHHGFPTPDGSVWSEEDQEFY